MAFIINGLYFIILDSFFCFYDPSKMRNFPTLNMYELCKFSGVLLVLKLLIGYLKLKLKTLGF